MAAISPRLEIRPSVALVITPQLRQAIKLLQLSNLDANAFVEEEIERNPLLERIEEAPPANALPDDRAENPAPLEPDGQLGSVRSDALAPPESDPPDGEPIDPYDGETIGTGIGRGGREDRSERTIEDLAGETSSLREHLSLQLRLAFDDPAERLIGAHLIAQLDPAGRLSIAPADLARELGADLATIERVRRAMLRFDPVGCFALDLKECLAAQLAEKDRLDPAMAALLDHLDLVAARALPELMALTGVDADDLADMLLELRRLDPKPGTRFECPLLPTLIPDIFVTSEEGGFRIELNSETLPRVLVNHALYRRISASAKGAERSFFSERLAAANWLVRALAQRADTILRVAREIVRTQEGFLRHGVGYLRPLTLHEVADALSLHESTVSRVTSNKCVATPRGTFELKYFFTPALLGLDGARHSAAAVRSRIKALIQAERPENVLSDDAIVRALRVEGVAIARRTVAKYREALRIPNSPQRRREKTMLA